MSFLLEFSRSREPRVGKTEEESEKAREGANLVRKRKMIAARSPSGYDGYK
jgi:hypothetical protein